MEIRPRRKRINTVRNKLRKYKNLTRSLCNKKVIMKITISLTVKMTIGRIYLLSSLVPSPCSVELVELNPREHPCSSVLRI